MSPVQMACAAPVLHQSLHCEQYLARLSKDVLIAAGKCGANTSVLPAKLMLAPPPRPEEGHFCFRVADILLAFGGKKMNEVADMLSGAIVSDLVVNSVAAGSWVNLWVTQGPLWIAAVKDVLACPPEEGQSQPAEAGQAQHWLIEFSSPNTNKPQHLGHVRNNLLGDACSRMLSAVGHTVTKVNLVNDRGIHICKSMLAYKKFGNGEQPGIDGCTQKGDHLVGHYYVEFEKHFQEEWKAWLASDSGDAQFLQWQKEHDGLKMLDKIKQMKEKAEQETNAKKKEQLLSKIPDLYESFKKSYKDVYFAKTSPLGIECGAMLEDWEVAAEGEAPEESEVYRLWQTMNSWVLDGFWATYNRLGISFDHIDYESQTYSLGKTICEDALACGICHRNSSGAVAVSYEKMPLLKLQGEKVLLRSNGTSVYMTQDLGTAVTRWDRHNADKMVYVVADEQREHFRILFELLSLLRPQMQGAFHHLSYGMVNLTSGRMKSREGTVVDADNLLDEVQDLATEATKQKIAKAVEKAKALACKGGNKAPGEDDDEDEDMMEELSEEEIQRRGICIGLAALKFYILNSPPQSTMLYNPSESIKFEGQTGPYILYCYARTRSVLRNSCIDVTSLLQSDLSCLETLGTTTEELVVLKSLFSFNDALLQAAKTHNPAKVCHAVFDVAQAFNKLFNQKEKHPIVNCTDPDLRNARLLLTESVGVALRKGLALLGISVLERM